MELSQKMFRQHPFKELVKIGTPGFESLNHVATLQSCIEIVVAIRIAGAQFKLHDTKQFNI